MELIWRRGAISGLALLGLLLLAIGIARLIEGLVDSPAAAWIGSGLFLLATAFTWFDSQRLAHGLSLLPLTLGLAASVLMAHLFTGLMALGLVAVTFFFSALGSYRRGRADKPTLMENYRSAVVARRIRSSEIQLALVQRLDDLGRQYVSFERKRRLPWGMFLAVPQGIYLHGPAGRGKSFLLDGLYDILPSRTKHRFHYHRLMAQIPDSLHRLQGKRHAFRAAARKLAQPGSLILVDELNVVDLVGARMLIPVLHAWIQDRCVLCISSNLPPDRLLANVAVDPDLRNQFQRLLNKRLEIRELAGPEDYREEKLAASDLYQTPITPDTPIRLQHIVTLLAEGAQSAAPIQFGDRLLPCIRQATGVAWFDFNALCGRPLGFRDYLTLVEKFPNIVISAVPELREEDPARRFAWLVELVYDAKKRLIISASVPLDLLFAPDLSSTGEATDFGKIQSRLLEMQSSEYNFVLGIS